MTNGPERLLTASSGDGRVGDRMETLGAGSSVFGSPGDIPPGLEMNVYMLSG